MPDIDPDGTGAGGDGTGEVKPVASPDGTTVAPGETVPVEQHKGLMRANSKQAEEIKRLKDELAAAKAAPSKPEPGAPAISPEVQRALDEIAAGQETVLGSIKATHTEGLLKEFPYAQATDITGNSPDEWRASAEAAHARAKTVIDAEVAKRAEEARKAMAEEYGIPFDSGGGEAPAGGDERAAALKKAKDAGSFSGYIETLLGVDK